MPILTLHTSVPLPAIVNQELACRLTEITESILGKKLPLTAAAIFPSYATWTIGGKPMGKNECTALLEIRVTSGTNTPQQKALWIAAAWNILEKHLPLPLSPVSYINIIEIAAENWGYGGLTQAARAAHQTAAVSANAASKGS